MSGPGWRIHLGRQEKLSGTSWRRTEDRELLLHIFHWALPGTSFSKCLLFLSEILGLIMPLTANECHKLTTFLSASIQFSGSKLQNIPFFLVSSDLVIKYAGTLSVLLLRRNEASSQPLSSQKKCLPHFGARHPDLPSYFVTCRKLLHLHALFLQVWNWSDVPVIHLLPFSTCAFHSLLCSSGWALQHFSLQLNRTLNFANRGSYLKCRFLWVRA